MIAAGLHFVVAMLVAPTREGVIEFVDPNATPAALVIPWASLLAIAGACIVIAVAVVVWRRSRPDDPGDEAFRILSRALGLSRADRALVRELAAAHGQAVPTAILLSEHALNEAVKAHRGVGDDERVDRFVLKLQDATRRIAA
ncbi:MAG: hypothetical protein ACKVU4_04735 [Phycisphaerales bacterium]